MGYLKSLTRGVIRYFTAPVVQFATVLANGVAAVAQGVVDVSTLKLPTVVAPTTEFVYGTVTVVKMLVCFGRPLVPEVAGMTKDDWLHMNNLNQALHSLNCVEDGGWLEPDTFLPAARVLTAASAAAYLTEAQATKLFGGAWEVELLESPFHSAQAMLFSARGGDQEYAIIAFRGTELPDELLRREFIPDWYRNLYVEQREYVINDKHYSSPEGEHVTVAAGFLKGWLQLRSHILERLEHRSRISGEIIQVFVTGHSQGGALASVSLLDLANEQDATAEENGLRTFSLRGCITVAQPKVGNSHYTEAVIAELGLDRIHLLANQNALGYDPAISLPPAGQALLGTSADIPPGYFWPIRVRQTTPPPIHGPVHRSIVRTHTGRICEDVLSNLKALSRLIAFPVHWPGGDSGYMAALKA